MFQRIFIFELYQSPPHLSDSCKRSVLMSVNKGLHYYSQNIFLFISCHRVIRVNNKQLLVNSHPSIYFLPNRRKLGCLASLSKDDCLPNRRKFGSPEALFPNRRKLGSAAAFPNRRKLGSLRPAVQNLQYIDLVIYRNGGNSAHWIEKVSVEHLIIFVVVNN